MTPEDHLKILLSGNREGFTRAELSHRLHLEDRPVRRLIEDAIVTRGLPIVADRTNGGEAHYRLAGKDEIDLVNGEVAELKARGDSCFKRARHLQAAWLDFHNAGSLFMRAGPA